MFKFKNMRSPILKNLLSAVTVTTTGSAIDVGNADKVVISFTEAGSVLNRSGVLTILGSIDGTNFFQINSLTDNVSTTNINLRIASKTRAAAGTDFIALPKEFTFTHIKAVCTITDGATPAGNFTANALVQYNYND